MKKESGFIAFLKSTPTIIVTCITLGGGAVGWVGSLVKESAEAKAELKAQKLYQEKYDKIATDYIMLTVKCNTND